MDGRAGFGGNRLTLGGSDCGSKLEEVVSRAYQAPLGADLLQAPHQKSPKPSGFLYLPKDRLDRLLAKAVSRVPSALTEPLTHVGAVTLDGELLLIGRRWRAVLLSSGREIRANVVPVEVLQVLFRAVPGIG